MLGSEHLSICTLTAELVVISLRTATAERRSLGRAVEGASAKNTEDGRWNLNIDLEQTSRPT